MRPPKSSQDRQPRKRAGRTRNPVAPLVLFACAACSGCFRNDDKPLIRLHEGQSDSHRLDNAIVAFIIEKGYGCRVETVMQTTYVMQMSFDKGTVDVDIEARRNELPKWYMEAIKAGTIINVGVILEGSAQFFMIPKWVADENNIKTVFDMRDHWKLFKDPESPSKGIFYNGPIGCGCDRINALKLQAYGLSTHFNVVSPPSAAALEVVLARHQESRQPVFGYYWAPNALLGSHEWRILQEPQYTDECWEQLLEAAEEENPRAPDRACAYKVIALEKIVHRGLVRKAPEIVDFLKKMVMNPGPLNDTLAWTKTYDVRDWRKPALYFLRKYEDLWREWVTPEAFEKVKAALAVAPGAARRE